MSCQHECWVLNSGPLREQWVLLTPEPSLDNLLLLVYVLSVLIWNWKQFSFSLWPHFFFFLGRFFSFVSQLSLNSLCSPDWPLTCSSSGSASWVLTVQALSTLLSLKNLGLRSWRSESWTLILCPTLFSLFANTLNFYLLNFFHHNFILMVFFMYLSLFSTSVFSCLYP